METPEANSGAAKPDRRSRKRSGKSAARPNAVDAAPRPRAPHSSENAIREGRRRAAATPAGERSGQAKLPHESRAERNAPQGPRGASTVPPEVAARFVRVGREFYFPDGTRAFSDRGRRLTTRSENTELIRSLIEIARARGWQSLVVSGTERFRREAWLAAQAAGVDARGYRPTEFEQVRAVRARARAQKPQSEQQTPPEVPDETRERKAVHLAQMRKREAQRRDWIKGRLLEHGPANYKHDPAQPPSYFVKLETKGGERTVWGVDLERALKDSLSRPQIGDRIALRALRRDAVTVRAPNVNGRGEVVGTRALGKHRNRWIVEQQQFLKLRAEAAAVFLNSKIDAREGARHHPELLGSYLQLQSAKALAGERIRDREDQAVFVERVRRVLAHSIARGEPLAPVRMREAPARRVAPQPTHRAAERDASLVR